MDVAEAPGVRAGDSAANGGGPRLTGPDRSLLWLFLLLLLALRLVMMAWMPLTDTTEARYAEIARKMVETGNWITPQFDYGVPFWGKPPLHTWLSALGMLLFGVGAFGSRIFILAAALGILWLVFDWARQRGQRDLGLVATVLCASSVLFFGAAAFVMTDMVMALGTTLSMVAFHRAVSGDARASGWLFFVGLAIGMLAKGPVAVILTGIPIGLWVIAGWRWRMLAALPWVGGTLLALLLTVPWFIAAERATPGFLHYFLVGEHVQRFLVPGWQGDLYGFGKDRPWGTIWLYALGALLPWSLAALALLGARARRAAWQQDGGWTSYLVLWSLSPLLLFTFAANILPAYVLPAVPALALLLAALWGNAFGYGGKTARRTFLAGAAFSVAGFVLYVGGIRFAPELVRLQTMDGLVERARQADASATLNVYPRRSFSAEFYSGGGAKTLTSIDAIRALADNGRRDALIVPVPEAAVAYVMGSDITELARTPRYALFIENAK